MKPMAEDEEKIWEVLDDSVVHCMKTREKYAFGTIFILSFLDKVYEVGATTSMIFDDVVKGLVSTSIHGINATVFAYGQTASGKTFTVRGSEALSGLIPLSITEIFKETAKIKDRKFKIEVSFLELYNETINDLLVENSEKLEIKENGHGVFIKGLSTFEATTPEQAMEFLKEGDARKKMAETQMNVQSSRSHTVFRLNVQSKPIDALPIVAARVSQLNIVDLAGSEGVSRTKAEGIRLRYVA
jgi:centromeric protein E